jgi:anti-sigma B factor antagonist
MDEAYLSAGGSGYRQQPQYHCPRTWSVRSHPVHEDAGAFPATIMPLMVPALVVLPAEIDVTNAAQVGEELHSPFRDGVRAVVADLTRTTYCDSSGARVLLQASDRATASRGELRLVLPPGPVLRALQIMGLDRLLRIYPTLITALAGGSPPGS